MKRRDAGLERPLPSSLALEPGVAVGAGACELQSRPVQLLALGYFVWMPLRETEWRGRGEKGDGAQGNQGSKVRLRHSFRNSCPSAEFLFYLVFIHR